MTQQQNNNSHRHPNLHSHSREGGNLEHGMLDPRLRGDDIRRSATISIIGKPNAGKSTLLNRVIGQKISIVTPKVQTTRSIITGVVTSGSTQLIFIDTPGIFEPKRNLERAMVRAAWSSIVSADFVMLILDAREELDEVQKTILARLNETGANLIILLNKMDLVRSARHCEDGQRPDAAIQNEDCIASTLDCFKPKVFTMTQFQDNTPLFRISAQNGDGVDALMAFLSSNAPNGPWLYNEDDITTLPMRFLASEITREQLFLALDQELPYNLTVETETWEDFKNGSVKIRQVIVVARASHKAIILGKNGSMIKMIGQKARVAISESLGFQAHLFLFVKVRANWDADLCKAIVSGGY